MSPNPSLRAPFVRPPSRRAASVGAFLGNAAGCRLDFISAAQWGSRVRHAMPRLDIQVGQQLPRVPLLLCAQHGRADQVVQPAQVLSVRHSLLLRPRRGSPRYGMPAVRAVATAEGGRFARGHRAVHPALPQQGMWPSDRKERRLQPSHLSALWH